MLILDAFDHVGEEEFHLILHGTELWDFSVGIFVKDIFDLTPFHFLATLMKECTLLSVLEAIGADEARFAALRIDTNHETLVAVDAFRRVFEML